MKLEKTESLKFTRKSKSKSPSPSTTPRRTRSTSSLAKKRSRLNSLDYDMKYDSKQVMIKKQKLRPKTKGDFFSERADAFVISPNR